MVKNLPVNARDTGGGLDSCLGKIPWKEEMATHYRILALEIPWTEEPGRPLSMGSQSWTRISMHT